MRRALVVEDDSVQQAVICRQLGIMGYVTIGVSSVATAIDCLNSSVDVLILDLYLPNGHGFEVLEALSRKRNDLAVIVVSAHPEEKRHRESFPILDWIDKPFALEDLRAAVEKAEASGKALNSLKESTRCLGRITGI